MENKMRVTLDRAKCHKCGLCAAICPEIFEIDRNSGARVKHLEVPPIGDLQEFCTYACQSCPTHAIEITPPPPAQTELNPLEELTAELERILVHH
jgi:ferredoxin